MSNNSFFDPSFFQDLILLVDGIGWNSTYSNGN